MDERRKPENAAIGAFVKRFCELYKELRGVSYLFRRKVDVPLVTLLLGTYEPGPLEAMARLLLITDDPWIAQTDRGIGILTVKASWLANALAERTRHTPKALADCATCENARWVYILEKGIQRRARCTCWKQAHGAA